MYFKSLRTNGVDRYIISPRGPKHCCGGSQPDTNTLLCARVPLSHPRSLARGLDRKMFVLLTSELLTSQRKALQFGERRMARQKYEYEYPRSGLK